jgi:hypothetical protein
MNEEAKKFLESKGYVPDENGKFIVTGDDGVDFDLAEMLDEYVSAKNTTPPVPPPPVKP